MPLVSTLLLSSAASAPTWRLVDYFSILLLLRCTVVSEEQLLQYSQDVLVSLESLLIAALERFLLFISFLLNASVFVLYVKTWKWPENKQKHRDENHIAAVKRFINRHSKILTAEDFLEDDDDDDCKEDEDDDDSIISLKIPEPGQVATTNNDSSSDSVVSHASVRSISRNCAICYLNYRKGDKIVWSSNPSCRHCYHSDCLYLWMIPGEERHQTCPCCRRQF